jgi:hypothetical protein
MLQPPVATTSEVPLDAFSYDHDQS